MALDIHSYEDGKHGELLLQIDDGFYGVLESSFELFRLRTGQFIDPYGDLIFSSGLGVLIRAVEECSSKVKQEDQRKHRSFLELLRRSEADGTHIIFRGD